MNLLMYNTFLLRFLLNTETANGSHKFSSICHFLSRLKTKLLCLSLTFKNVATFTSQRKYNLAKKNKRLF